MVTVSGDTASVQEYTENIPSPLLSLPPELRSIIWEYALYEHGVINITPSLKPPPLLQVSGQIREEAADLWLRANTFQIDIDDCDMTLFNKFSSLVREVTRTGSGVWRFDRMDAEWRFHLHTANWPNLMDICLLVWKGASEIITSTPDDELTVVHAATEIAASAREARTSWETCRAQLGSLRRVAGRLNPKWLDD